MLFLDLAVTNSVELFLQRVKKREGEREFGEGSVKGRILMRVVTALYECMKLCVFVFLCVSLCMYVYVYMSFFMFSLRKIKCESM